MLRKKCPGCEKAIPESFSKTMATTPHIPIRCSSCGTQCHIYEGGKPTLPGADARDEAIKRVDAHASETWKRVAWSIVRYLAETQLEFTTDDVWQALKARRVTTHEPRAIGAVMRSFAKSGVIRNTKRMVESNREACHRRPVTVWESLLEKH